MIAAQDAYHGAARWRGRAVLAPGDRIRGYGRPAPIAAAGTLCAVTQWIDRTESRHNALPRRVGVRVSGPPLTKDIHLDFLSLIGDTAYQ
jgi:hypothetical protein